MTQILSNVLLVANYPFLCTVLSISDFQLSQKSNALPLSLYLGLHLDDVTTTELHSWQAARELRANASLNTLKIPRVAYKQGQNIISQSKLDRDPFKRFIKVSRLPNIWIIVTQLEEIFNILQNDSKRTRSNCTLTSRSGRVTFDKSAEAHCFLWFFYNQILQWFNAFCVDTLVHYLVPTTSADCWKWAIGQVCLLQNHCGKVLGNLCALQSNNKKTIHRTGSKRSCWWVTNIVLSDNDFLSVHVT